MREMPMVIGRINDRATDQVTKGSPSRCHPAPAALIEPLTARELAVLWLVADGCSNQEIADTLILSIGTIKWYTRQIYSKLGVQTRTQAIARARALHLLD